MEAIFKAFSTHKRGERSEDNQDSICINAKKCIYALSDGVSKSFLPRLLSDILTKSFVDTDDIDNFPDSNLSHSFKNKRDEYLSSLDDFGLMIQECAEEEFHTGAATFAGVKIHNGKLLWKVIGDSCLFIIDDDGAGLKCISSCFMSYDETGKLTIDFDNTPSHIKSDGTIVGRFVSGSIELYPCWIIIMSDALSEWFIKQYNDGINVTEELYSIECQDEFEQFVDKEYQEKRLKNDDISFILIRVMKKGEVNILPIANSEDISLQHQIDSIQHHKSSINKNAETIHSELQIENKSTIDKSSDNSDDLVDGGEALNSSSKAVSQPECCESAPGQPVQSISSDNSDDLVDGGEALNSSSKAVSQPESCNDKFKEKKYDSEIQGELGVDFSSKEKKDNVLVVIIKKLFNL